MAKHGYICNKAGLVFGRRTLYPGMPVPPSEVTDTLLKLEWVRVGTVEEYAEAVKEYGEPPEKLGPKDADWNYKGGKRKPFAGVEETAAPRGEPEEVDATDSARELAEEHDLDLSTVEASGANGRITKKDVRAAIKAAEA